MRDPRQLWQAVYEAFDPEVPVHDTTLRAERDPRYNAVAAIADKLGRPYGERKYLLTGTVGTGKTTELLFLVERLAPHRVVVFVDLWRHFERTVGEPAALDRVQSWELMGLLGLALYRVGNERFSHQWGEAPERLARALEVLRSEADDSAGEIDLAKLTANLAVVVGGAGAAALAGPGAGLAGGLATKTTLDTLKAIGSSSAWKWPIGLRAEPRPQTRTSGSATCSPRPTG